MKRKCLKIITYICLTAMLILTSCSQSDVGNHSECALESFEQTEGGAGLAVFEGKEHDFILCSPEVAEKAPLIIMLHGYGESAEALRAKTSFEQDAVPCGYAVAYVTGVPTPEDPTSAAGWNSGIGISSNNDVEFLCAFVNELCEEYAFDRRRVYAVGFSNGAFMVHRLAIEAGDIFSAVVSVAGMMPEKIWEKKPDKCEMGILQITGEKDDVVPKNSDGTAKFTKAPAIEDVMEYFAAANGLSLASTETVGKKATLQKYSSADSKKQVWHLFVPDGRHSWPDEQFAGFSTNQIIIDFLETQ